MDSEFEKRLLRQPNGRSNVNLTGTPTTPGNQNTEPFTSVSYTTLYLETPNYIYIETITISASYAKKTNDTFELSTKGQIW